VSNEEKVKEYVETSVILSVDSSETTFVTHLPGGSAATAVEFPGHVTVSPGGGGGHPGPQIYQPVCAYPHVPDDPGVQSNGTWLGNATYDASAAFTEAYDHSDGHAYVARLLGSTLVGPIDPASAGL
jgi:hypothetical protein